MGRAVSWGGARWLRWHEGASMLLGPVWKPARVRMPPAPAVTRRDLRRLLGNGSTCQAEMVERPHCGRRVLALRSPRTDGLTRWQRLHHLCRPAVRAASGRELGAFAQEAVPEALRASLPRRQHRVRFPVDGPLRARSAWPSPPCRASSRGVPPQDLHQSCIADCGRSPGRSRPPFPAPHGRSSDAAPPRHVVHAQSGIKPAALSHPRGCEALCKGDEGRFVEVHALRLAVSLPLYTQVLCQSGAWFVATPLPFHCCSARHDVWVPPLTPRTSTTECGMLMSQ